jgi:hypothetical protein
MKQKIANLSKWNISIEYGPVAADVHHIVVDAANSEEALIKAEKWAKDNNVKSPMFSEPYEDSYDDFLEWTPEEEEEFLLIVSKSTNIDES